MFNTFHQDGVVAFNSKLFEGAKFLFQKAIQNNPEVLESYYYLGSTYVYCGEVELAISTLNQYIELAKVSSVEASKVSSVLCTLGQCYVVSAQHKKAFESFNTAIRIDSNCALACHNLGLYYLQLAQRCLQTNTSDSQVHFNTAQSFLLKALALNQSFPLFLNSVARWHEKYIDALQYHREDEAEKDEQISTHYQYAIKYYRTALIPSQHLETAFEKSIIVNLTKCLAQYAGIVYRSKNFTEAQKYYCEVIELDQNNFFAIYQAGMCCWQQKNYKEAKNYFFRIAQTSSNPQNVKDAENNIAYLCQLEQESDQMMQDVEKPMGSSSISNQYPKKIFPIKKSLLPIIEEDEAELSIAMSRVKTA